VLPRHLQDMQVDIIIMTCNVSRPRATVQRRAADHPWVQLVEAMTRQGKGYVVGHMPRGRVYKTGRAGRHKASLSYDICI
jgi:hypothetical protein